MIQVIRAPRAEQDIREVLKYMNARWSRSQALQYAELIRDAEIAIANDPMRRTTSINKRLVRHPGGFARHILFYRVVSANTIEIIRFLHEAMDYQEHVLQADYAAC